jgi:hypothetical protein
LNKSDFA